MRPFIDSRRDGDASGMPDPEMCVSGRDFSCLSGMLDDKKIGRGKRIRKMMHRKPIRKASLYSYALMGSQPFGLCTIASQVI